MAETLVIRLPEDDSSTAECLLVDPSGAPLGDISSGSLDNAANLTEGRRVIGLVPATQVLRTSADIPLRNKAKIQQALPFALEEHLAADVDEQHFAFGGRDSEGRIPVAVVAAETVAGWLEQFGAAGIRLDALFAESDGLTLVPSTITVLVDGQRCIIREANGTTTVVEPHSMQAVLELIIDDEPASEPEEQEEAAVVSEDSAHDETIVEDAVEDAVDDTDAIPVNILVYCREQDYDSHAVLWDMLRLRVDSLDVNILPDGALPRLASQIATTAGVNLLQGPYAPKREIPVDLEKWRIPGILGAALIAVMLLGSGLQLWQLTQEEAALDEAAASLLTSTFPEVNNVTDPWRQLRSRLGNSSGDASISVDGAGFADVLAALAAAIRDIEGITPEAIGYRDGKLDLQLVAPSVDLLEKLRQGIITDGLMTAEIQSANPDGEQIKGRMRISLTNPNEER